MSDFQMEINFAPRGGNRFGEALSKGEFVLLIEGASPEPGVHEPAPGAEQLAHLASELPEIPGIHLGLAILDRGAGVPGALRAVELAARLPEEERDRHLVYLSGAETSPEAARELLGIAANAGIRNLVAVSGDAPSGISAAECSRRRFTESTELLSMISAVSSAAPAGAGFLAGAVVNPHQYTPWSLLGQYYKADAEFAAGAEFLIAQAGWDMLKIQSLAWRMIATEAFYPRLARLVLLTPLRVERILAGEMPGVRIAPALRAQLERELRYSKSQFEAAQYRRLALQAAGCRLMGYNGIQLAGAESPLRARISAERIRSALEEFNFFDAWLEEYNSCMAETEVSPFGDNFTLYDRILHRDYPADEPALPNDTGEPPVSVSEGAMRSLRGFLFAHAGEQRASHGRLLKKLLCGCRSCDRCRLPEHEYLCLHRYCPKQLAAGPCGGVRPDGRCETGDFECFHHRVVRLRMSRRKTNGD